MSLWKVVSCDTVTLFVIVKLLMTSSNSDTSQDEASHTQPFAGLITKAYMSNFLAPVTIFLMHRTIASQRASLASSVIVTAVGKGLYQGLCHVSCVPRCFTMVVPSNGSSPYAQPRFLCCSVQVFKCRKEFLLRMVYFSIIGVSLHVIASQLWLHSRSIWWPGAVTLRNF